MKISIIIPYKSVSENLIESVEHCKKINYPDFEIILLPDNHEPHPFSEVIVIPTGPLPPSHKRDIGAQKAGGDLLAFIDDDAYPTKEWLTNANKNFISSDIAAVGGPGVTPDNEPFMHKVSGLIFSSFLASGPFSSRYSPKKKTTVDEHPSCNFIIRKSVFNEIGGFSTNLWPGEDTKLCLGITKQLKKKIIYDPEVVVFHHRRKFPSNHLLQVWKYGALEAQFMKKDPELFNIKDRLFHLVPTLSVLGFFLGLILSLIYFKIKLLFLTTLSIYLIIIWFYFYNLSLLKKNILAQKLL